MRSTVDPDRQRTAGVALHAIPRALRCIRGTLQSLILRSGRQAASRRMRHTKTTDTTPHSHGANSPELCTNRFAFLENRGRRECRVLAAPAASRAK